PASAGAQWHGSSIFAVKVTRTWDGNDMPVRSPSSLSLPPWPRSPLSNGNNAWGERQRNLAALLSQPLMVVTSWLGRPGPTTETYPGTMAFTMPGWSSSTAPATCNGNDVWEEQAMTGHIPYNRPSTRGISWPDILGPMTEMCPGT